MEDEERRLRAQASGELAHLIAAGLFRHLVKIDTIKRVDAAEIIEQLRTHAETATYDPTGPGEDVALWMQVQIDLLREDVLR